MATTVHLSIDLLKRVDRRAGELGVSRNRYIVAALERALEQEATWSPRFLDTVREARADAGSHSAIDEMMRHIASRRTRKRPPKL